VNQFTKTFSAIIIIAFALMIPTQSFSQVGNGNQKIQLIHAADFEASTSATESAPNFAAIVQAFDKYAADNNITNLMLLSGDNYLPGPFFSSGGDPTVRAALRTALGNPSAREDAGRIDIAICNVLGVEASSIGNHEFDLGTSVFQGLISPDVRNNGADPRWMGAHNSLIYLQI